METPINYHEYLREVGKIMYFRDVKTMETFCENTYNIFCKHYLNSVNHTIMIMKQNFDVELDDVFPEDERAEAVWEIFEEYMSIQFSKKKISDDGYTLKSNLLRRAVQYKHDENRLGVIIEIVEDNPRYLIVDFLDAEPIKIDIDELIIPSQQNG